MSSILIIDGQRNSRQYLAAILGSCGNSIVEAGDGAEAMEILATANFDLAISDVLMYRMDGYEFVEQLRTDSAIAQPPPVIFCVTPSYLTEAKTAAAQCGVGCVIAKDSVPDAVVEAANSLLSSRRNGDPKPLKLKLDHVKAAPPLESIDPEATVFVVDDDPAILRLMSSIMTSSNLRVRTFASAAEFLNEYKDEPGCLLTDIQMAGASGISLLTTLRARRMLIPAIIMTSRGELADARQAIRLQVWDFLDKSVSRRTLLARVYSALQEDSIQRQARFDIKAYQQRMSTLTAREWELVNLLIEGLASKEIAARLKISIKTVSIHRTHLMAKTGASNVADLVRMSMIARDNSDINLSRSQ